MLFLHVQLIRAQELHEAQLCKGYQLFHFIFISCYYSISILQILSYYLIKYLTFPFKSIKMVFTAYWVGHQLILSRVEAIKSGKRHIVQSFYGKKSVNLPLIATEGFSTVLDSAMYPY